jgi:hypothetical protein
MGSKSIGSSAAEPGFGSGGNRRWTLIQGAVVWTDSNSSSQGVTIGPEVGASIDVNSALISITLSPASEKLDSEECHVLRDTTYEDARIYCGALDKLMLARIFHGDVAPSPRLARTPGRGRPIPAYSLVFVFTGRCANLLISIKIVQVCDDFFQGSLAAKERKEHKDGFGSMRSLRSFAANSVWLRPRAAV